MNLLSSLLIGAAAGWIAGQVMKGRGFGLLGNIVVGVVGSIIGGQLFGILGLSAGGTIGVLLMSVAGAVVLLFLIGLIKKS